MTHLAFFIGVFILGAVVVITHKETVLLSERLAALQRKESVSNRSRIAACKALEDLITGRCVDMEKHIETYQDLQRKKFKAVHTRIDDGSLALTQDRERVTERLDNLAMGCVQTNTRLDKGIKDLRNQVHVLQLESIGVSVPVRELNADEVSA